MALLRTNCRGSSASEKDGANVAEERRKSLVDVVKLEMAEYKRRAFPGRYSDSDLELSPPGILFVAEELADQFWARMVKENRRFPNLCRLAGKLFCIPASSTPSERLFSDLANTISEARNRLGVDTAFQQVFLRRNLKYFPEFFLRGFLVEDKYSAHLDRLNPVYEAAADQETQETPDSDDDPEIIDLE